jgi:acetyl esterase/lipase
VATFDNLLIGSAPFPALLEDCKAHLPWLGAHTSSHRFDPEQIENFS